MRNITSEERGAILSEFEKAGISKEDLGPEHWINYIIQYRETGGCGSVNASSVEFIPIISKLLETINEAVEH